MIDPINMNLVRSASNINPIGKEMLSITNKEKGKVNGGNDRYDNERVSGVTDKQSTYHKALKKIKTTKNGLKKKPVNAASASSATIRRSKTKKNKIQEEKKTIVKEYDNVSSGHESSCLTNDEVHEGKTS